MPGNPAFPHRQVDIRVGQVWRGINHGSLYRVLLADDTTVHALSMYEGNPYWASKVGTIRKFPRAGWDALVEYAPEWNDQEDD